MFTFLSCVKKTNKQLSCSCSNQDLNKAAIRLCKQATTIHISTGDDQKYPLQQGLSLLFIFAGLTGIATFHHELVISWLLVSFVYFLICSHGCWLPYLVKYVHLIFYKSFYVYLRFLLPHVYTGRLLRFPLSVLLFVFESSSGKNTYLCICHICICTCICVWVYLVQNRLYQDMVFYIWFT